MGRGADEVCLGAARLAKAPNGINEIQRPADKQGDHEQVDVDHEVIQFLAMLGGERRQGKDFHFERTICWPVTAAWVLLRLRQRPKLSSSDRGKMPRCRQGRRARPPKDSRCPCSCPEPARNQIVRNKRHRRAKAEASGPGKPKSTATPNQRGFDPSLASMSPS